MAKRPKKESPHKLRPDVAETAYRVMQEAIGEAPKTLPPGERSEAQKHPEAVRRGKEGGKKGGKARADTLSPDELSKMAKKAAEARWQDETANRD